jgi:prolyl 4-hydroxylase
MNTASPVDMALQLAAANRTRDAVQLLEAAGQAGNAEAWMQLAVWSLVGQALPRDLRLARVNLRKAVEIGHVDAALMEIALTANGSGGVPDWRGALGLLKAAATSDPVADQHLKLVEALRLNAEGHPQGTGIGTAISETPTVWHFPALLSREECAHIAQNGSEILEEATVADPHTGAPIAHPIRTSSSGVIGPGREDLVVRAINMRLAAITGTRVDQGEPLIVLRYETGQQYRPHVDALPATKNQRIKTVLIYLNEGYSGGETEFLANGLNVAGRAGDAIVFDNATPDGTPVQNSRHAGLPVMSGVKWLATRWIRMKSYDPWTDHGT